MCRHLERRLGLITMRRYPSGRTGQCSGRTAMCHPAGQCSECTTLRHLSRRFRLITWRRLVETFRVTYKMASHKRCFRFRSSERLLGSDASRVSGMAGRYCASRRLCSECTAMRRRPAGRLGRCSDRTTKWHHRPSERL